MRVLITSGATREPVDSVRFLTNLSSGVTGARIADYFTGKGCEVSFLRGIQSEKPLKFCQIENFDTCQNLQDQIKEQLSLKNYDAVIHLAAVSDYTVDKVRVGEREFEAPVTQKIDSGESLDLVLKKNPKIIDHIRSFFQTPTTKLVGFKLTSRIPRADIEKAVFELFPRAGVDFVVHNMVDDLLEGRRVFEVFDARGSIGICEGVEALSEKLFTIVSPT